MITEEPDQKVSASEKEDTMTKNRQSRLEELAEQTTTEEPVAQQWVSMIKVTSAVSLLLDLPPGELEVRDAAAVGKDCIATRRRKLRKRRESSICLTTINSPNSICASEMVPCEWAKKTPILGLSSSRRKTTRTSERTTSSAT